MSIREQEFPMRRKVYKIFATLFAVAVVGLVEHLDKKSRADEAAVLRQRQAEDEAKVRAGAVREAKGLARERFGGRIAALKAHCQSRESANEKRPNHWLYSKPTHLAYCINPKVRELIVRFFGHFQSTKLGCFFTIPGWLKHPKQSH